MKHIEELGTAISALDQLVERDNAYWEELATGQDTEEAEDSGYIVGFRDGLSAAHQLMGYADSSTLVTYLDELSERVRMREEDV